ncbi:MAG TPA: peptide ABC transporter substrate-binding protein [Opitutae bacterium]|nr:peptide ABC transporter substrate-binding protein [Opitutae bacterium]
MYSTKRISLLTLLITALAFSACSQKPTPVAQGNQTQTLLVGNAAEPEELDPHLTTGVTELKIELALFEGLTTQHPQTLAPQPGVAESWAISDDGRTYTFHLRPDARWSNGDPVTAKDFVFSYKRILSPNLGAPYASMLYLIANAELYNLGELKDFNEVGIKAIDSHTLEIKLEQPTPYFLSMLGHMAFYPVHPPTILKFGAIDARGTGWTRPSKITSNGPFMLKDWIVGDCITVIKNPQYHKAAQVKLEEIRFYPMENMHTEERAFRAGQLHITETFPGDKLEAYRKENSPYLQIHPYLGIEFYWFNMNRPPFHDVRVRQALALAINRKALVENVAKRGQLAAYSMTPPDIGGYTSENHLQESVTEAQRLLAEAGYPNGEGFPKVELTFNTSVDRRKIAEAVQAMWKENLNINVSLLNQEWKYFLTTRNEGNYDICRGGGIGDYVDPYTFLELFESSCTNNQGGWSNGEYDLLMEKASRTTDQQKRFEVMQKAESIALEGMPVIPVFYFNSASLVQTSVHGWYPNLLNIHPYQYIWLEENAS